MNGAQSASGKSQSAEPGAGFRRLACYEAVRRQKIVTPDDVVRFCSMPMAEVLHHLEALKREGKVVEKAGIFSPA